MISKEEKKAYDKEYRLKNREKIKLLKKSHYEKNRERILEKEKFKRQQGIGKDKRTDTKRRYYIKNIETFKSRSKTRYQNKREEILEKMRLYRIKNKNIINARKRGYRENIKNKIAANFRSRLSGIIKTKKRTFDLIGCSRDELIIYLESKFLDGMTWENYGIHGWHIDHIIPINKFNLENEEDQKRCFHYSNLQPLWAKDNLSKGSRIIN